MLLSALLAASETALFALTRMEHTREQLSAPVRDALDRLMRRPLESLIVAIGLNEASNVFAECLGDDFLSHLARPAGGYVAVPVMFILVLLFCDITPKTFALGFPGGVATDHGASAGGAGPNRSSAHAPLRPRSRKRRVPNRFPNPSSRRCCGWAKISARSSPPSAR